MDDAAHCNVEARGACVNSRAMDGGDVARVLFFLVVIGIVLAVVLLRKKKTNVVNARVAYSTPLVTSFFTKTGYAFDDLRGAPPAMQTQRWEDMYRRTMNGESFAIRVARMYQGIVVRWENVTAYQYRRVVWSQTWSAPAPAPLSVPFHLTERKNLQPPNPQSNMQSNWRPAFPQMVPIGDPELDHRFALFTPVDVARVRAIVTHPQLRQSLLTSAYVDLKVMPDGAHFSDSRDENAIAMLGAQQAAHLDMVAPGKKMDDTVPMHERIANILLGALSLAR